MRTAYFAALLAAIVLFAFAGVSRADEASDLKDAKEAIRDGDHETALGKLLPLAAGAADANIKRKAHYAIGEMYENGLGLGQDLAQAFAHYELAADDKVPEAKLKQAIFVANGQGRAKREPEKSIKLLTELLKVGVADKVVLARVHYQLGLQYLSGTGTPENFTLAEAAFRNAVSKDVPQSFKYLAQMAQKGFLTGRTSWPDAYLWWSLAVAFAPSEAEAKDMSIKRDGARASTGDPKVVSCAQNIAQQISEYAKGNPPVGFKIDDPAKASALSCFKSA